MHYPKIPHPKNITLSQHGSKTVPMPPFFYLAFLTQSVVPWSIIRTSNRPSNMGVHKIIQPYLYRTSTKIHIIWLTTINCFKGTQSLQILSLKNSQNSSGYRVTTHINRVTYICQHPNTTTGDAILQSRWEPLEKFIWWGVLWTPIPTFLGYNIWTWIPKTTSSCGRSADFRVHIHHKVKLKCKP